MSEWSITPPGEVHEVDSDSDAYERFRTGHTFASVARDLALEARNHFERTGERMFVTRRTVLGRLHQLKQAAWRGRRTAWDLDADHVPQLDYPTGPDSGWKVGDPF